MFGDESDWNHHRKDPGDEDEYKCGCGCMDVVDAPPDEVTRVLVNELLTRILDHGVIIDVHQSNRMSIHLKFPKGTS